MNLKLSVKLIADALMSLCLFLLMGYQLWGDSAHEWIGTGMFVLFTAHHLLNVKWYKGIFSGKLTKRRVCTVVLNIFLISDMVLLAFSGITMSNHVFAFLDIRGHTGAARIIHIIASYWGFVLMSVHTGMHWEMISGIIKKRTGLTCGSDMAKAAVKIVSALIAAYGVYAFCKRDFLTYMLGRTYFVFFDFSEPAALFYADYIAIMATCIYLTHTSCDKRRRTDPHMYGRRGLVSGRGERGRKPDAWHGDSDSA